MHKPLKLVTEITKFLKRSTKKLLNILITLIISSTLLFLLSEYIVLPHIKYQKRPHSQIFSNEEFIQNGDYRNFFTLDLWEIWKPRPNTSIVADYWETDEYGFRLNPDHKNSQKSSKNILVIGDSFAYGHGVSHTEAWPAILEKLFNQSGKNIIFNNAGVPASGSDQHYIRLVRFVEKFRPQAVIWMISLNDIQDNKFSCLFKRINSNNFRQLPAFLNVAYINAFLMKYLPKTFSFTNTGNVLTTLTFEGKDLYTLGCSSTKLTEVQSEALYFEKLNYLAKKTKTLLSNNKVKLVFLITPYQSYFDHQHDNDSYEVKMITKLRETLTSSQTAFIDLNTEISKTYDPVLFAYRQNGSLAKTDKLNILGVSSRSGLTDNPQLNFKLYLDEHESFDYGGWHLNAEGNRVLAEIVYENLQDEF